MRFSCGEAYAANLRLDSAGARSVARSWGYDQRQMPKPTDIDRLYGLEPVIEPAGEAGSDALEQFVEAACPYCGEMNPLRLDLSAGSQSYVEDCQVCCQPIQIRVQVNEAGELESVSAERSDR
jgi:hypothetical protein